MAPPLLTLQDIHLSFGGDPLLVGAELSLHENDRMAIVGRNGSGKSTLLKIAAGFVEPDEGVRFLQPGTKICYLPQEPDFSSYETAYDYVLGVLDEKDNSHVIAPLLDALKVDPECPTASMSGGEARRTAIAAVLAPGPDILLLDEPTNHLDLPAIEWLERELKSFPGAIITISHDRRFLDTVSRSTLWVDGGATRFLSKGFGAFEAWRDELLEREEMEAHKLARKIVREEHWLRYGVTARRKRNQKRLGALLDLRAEKKAMRNPRANVQMENQQAETSGKLVIDAEGVKKSFGDQLIVKDLDLRLARGDKLGIVGPNGAGKTTLIKLLTGELLPDSGGVKLGTNLKIVTLDQTRESLKPNWTLQDALTNGGGDMVEVNGKPRHVIGYMKDFLFNPGQARTPLEALSGGERGRLMLARALSLPSNLMVLDEPTNDLDLETLDLLQELLADYEGSVLLVSHDRDFLDRVVTSTLVFDGDDNPGGWTEYAGGYSASLEQRGKNGEQKPSVKVGNSKDPGAKKALKKGSQDGAKQKLSYKDKYALETLPGEIERLAGEISGLEAEMADPELFQRDPERFKDIAARLDKLRKDHGKAEESWLTLEMLREELEGS